MTNRIYYTIAAASAVAAAIIVTYQWLKEHQPPVDNVYPLHKEIQ